MKNIEKKYNSKSFKKSSICKTKTEKESFKFLIDHKAIKKVPSPHTYVLTQFHDHVIEQIQLKKNPPIIYKTDYNSILKDAIWQTFKLEPIFNEGLNKSTKNLINVHNIEIEAIFEGLHNDLKRHYRDYQPFIDETIQNTNVKAFSYYDKTMITIQCSEKPIYSNQILRFNKILAQIIELINSNPYVTNQYDYDYQNFTVVKYDKAIDGKIPYRLKKGSSINCENKDDQGFYYYNTDGQKL